MKHKSTRTHKTTIIGTQENTENGKHFACDVMHNVSHFLYFLVYLLLLFYEFLLIFVSYGLNVFGNAKFIA